MEGHRRRPRRKRPRPEQIAARLKKDPSAAPRPPRTPNPVPCMLCGESLDHCGPPDQNGFLHNQPCGTAFESRGHYGSSFFDPGYGGIWIEIAFHDNCLRKHPERIRLVQKQTSVVYETLPLEEAVSLEANAE